jgi:hypothetical protein
MHRPTTSSIRKRRAVRARCVFGTNAFGPKVTAGTGLRFALACAVSCWFAWARIAIGAPFQAIDQSNYSATGIPGTGIPPNDDSIGQSFVPSLSGVDAVELDLRIYTLAGTGEDVVARINLRDGVAGADGLGGNIIGSSVVQTISGFLVATYHFDFPFTVSLTPGNTYVAHLERVSGTGIIGFLAHDRLSDPTDPYVNGQIYMEGFPIQNRFDAVFATGLHVPEPSSWLMFVVGLIAVGFARLRFRRRHDLPSFERSFSSAASQSK